MTIHECQECQQCDERRLAEVHGLCVPCYQAAKALGYTDDEIAALDPGEDP